MASLQPPSSGVVLYMSSVPASIKIRKDTSRVIDILTARKIEFVQVDVATDEEAKEYMRSKCGNSMLPKLFVNGEHKGGADQLEEANEDGAVKEWLGI
ncbi:hypothetical protein HDV05_001377 [Chytridiales sp. JEL 0842]|nr:hypothetical protein HDV05_001377 [Chytridiales sp. JEL 0842]